VFGRNATRHDEGAGVPTRPEQITDEVQYLNSDVWLQLKILPARTLTDWVVSAWLDAEVNPDKPLKPTGTGKIMGLSTWNKKMAEARELLDAVKED
jgi:hypothetical protein